MAEKSFRKFIEEEEKGSRYISSLEDELGIDPKDLEKEPQIASFFSIGGITRNLGPYRIIKFKRNSDGEITHAVVSVSRDTTIKNRSYKDEEGRLSRINGDRKEDKQFIVPIEDLDKLLSQDFQPPSGGESPGGVV